MFVAKFPFALCALLFISSHVSGTAYFPSSCSKTCLAGDFITDLADISAADGSNRAYFWASVALNQLKTNIAKLSPPAAARIAAVVGTCLYEAAAMNHEGLKSSLSSSYSFSVSGGGKDALTATLDGAGFWAVRAIFGEKDSFSEVFDLYSRVGHLDLDALVDKIESGGEDSVETLVSLGHSYDDVYLGVAAAGAQACKLVIDHFMADGYEADGTMGDKSYPANQIGVVNRPQRLAGITDCDNEMADLGAWQPLCVPSSPEDFGTTKCEVQEFLAPFASRFTSFALEEGNELMGHALVGPPPATGSKQFEEEWKEVLEFSANLDDVDKIIAEYWADGPDSTAPPGHWFKIAADAAITEGLDQIDTARLLFIVGNAVNDAGVACWRTKFTYNFVRPLQMIQCGEYRGQTKTAWKGPYMGVGLTNISEWRPYQASNFVTPAFPAYMSGHSTFSAAAAEALALFFDDDSYKGPPCYRVKEGESLFEPRSDELPGFSDIPNTGSGTIGYVPSEDVVLCWDTYTAAADQAGNSRFLGGIHVRADDVSGQAVGRRLGRDVFFKAQELVHSSPKHGFGKHAYVKKGY